MAAVLPTNAPQPRGLVLSVAKRRKTAIKVGDETFYWQVQPHRPGDHEAGLLVVSNDKRLHFWYPMGRGEHHSFVSRLTSSGYNIPVPTTPITLEDETRVERTSAFAPMGMRRCWELGLISAFEVTPGFVRSVIEWCLETGVLRNELLDC